MISAFAAVAVALGYGAPIYSYPSEREETMVATRCLACGLVLGSLLSVGCSAVPEDGEGKEGWNEEAANGAAEGIGESEQPLASELFGPAGQQVVYAHKRYRSMPDVAFTQYASPTLVSGGATYCNGIMIGPQILMTAAHCGLFPRITIRFRTYRGPTGTTQNSEDFTCKMLLQTFADTDLSVGYCEPNAAGENPGDKYGYVDFDTSAPTTGMSLYSISGNGQLNGDVPMDARMYCSGKVTATNNNGWFVPNDHPNIGITMDLWGEAGFSGSAHLNPANHRVTVGPLSVAAGSGAWERYALSMHDYFWWGEVATEDQCPDPNTPGQDCPPMITENINALGLDANNYFGWLDKELDYRIDIQTDIEKRKGEARRSWYSLGFESERRNALWDRAAFTTFDTASSWARIHRTSGSGFADVLWHPRLNLAAGTYRVSLMTYTQSVESWTNNILWVGFKSGEGEYVPTVVGSGWQMHTLQITAPSDGAWLVLGVWDTVDIFVTAVSVVKSGAVMDFDTFDKRVHWRNDNTGARAQVVPDGRVTGTPNWAVRVPYDGSIPGSYPVRNRQLALVGGRRYRICLDHQRDGGVATSGELRLSSSGQVATSVAFTPGASWATSCTPIFTAPTDNNMVQMRAGSAGGAYFADNIVIQDQ